MVEGNCTMEEMRRGKKKGAKKETEGHILLIMCACRCVCVEEIHIIPA